MMYVRYPLSLRQVEALLFERGNDLPPRNLHGGVTHRLGNPGSGLADEFEIAQRRVVRHRTSTSAQEF